IDVAYTGDTLIEGIYSDYRDFGGVKFPMHIIMREGRYPTLDLTVVDVQPNSTVALQSAGGNLPAPGRSAGARGAPGPGAAAAPTEPQPEKIADGVWFLTPGIEGSILVEFNDYVVVIEAPGNEAYTMAALAGIKRIAPNKPIKYVVNSHHHADHAA